MAQTKDTEKQILEAAKQVFIEKGFEAARMQEIADKAGINKALLHYYFRSKEKLFQQILNSVFEKMLLPQIFLLLGKDLNFFDLIRELVKAYITVLNQNPSLPWFILSEINRDPDRAKNVIPINKMPIENIFTLINIEADAGNIKPISPEQLFVNILSLCLFPYAAKPLINTILFKDNKEESDNFFETRAAHISDFIISSIKK